MSSTYVEGCLEFMFGDGWNVVRYDDSGGWYRRVFERAVEGTAAIDFLALHGPGALYFIEVTDARGHAISSKNAQRRESLAQETGRKVRDTVAGVVGAMRTDRDDPFWDKAGHVLADVNNAIFVSLWYEPAVGGPDNVRIKRRKGALDTLAKDLKKRLRWLAHNKYVSVRSMKDAGLPPFPEVTVKSVAVTSQG